MHIFLNNLMRNQENAILIIAYFNNLPLRNIFTYTLKLHIKQLKILGKRNWRIFCYSFLNCILKSSKNSFKTLIFENNRKTCNVERLTSTQTDPCRQQTGKRGSYRLLYFSLTHIQWLPASPSLPHQRNCAMGLPNLPRLEDNQFIFLFALSSPLK